MTDKMHMLIGISNGPLSPLASIWDGSYESQFLLHCRPGDEVVVKDRSDLRLEHNYIPPTKDDNVTSLVQISLRHVPDGKLLWVCHRPKHLMFGTPELVWAK